MKVRTKPLCGAVALAAFITLCLLWMVSGLGKKPPWALYGLVFLTATVGVYAFAINLTIGNDRDTGNTLDAAEEADERH